MFVRPFHPASRCATTTTDCLTRQLRTCLRTCVKAFMLIKIKCSQIWWNPFLVLCSNHFFTWCKKPGKTPPQKNSVLMNIVNTKCLVTIPLKDLMGIAHCPRILWNILEWGHLLVFVSGSVWDPPALSRSQWHSSHQALRVECVWSGPPCRCSCSWKRVGVSLRGEDLSSSLSTACLLRNAPPPTSPRSCISPFAIWHVHTKFTVSEVAFLTLHSILFCFV